MKDDTKPRDGQHDADQDPVPATDEPPPAAALPPTEIITTIIEGKEQRSSHSPLPDSVPDHIGPYRIEAVIGRGAVGVVYKAVHETLGRPVALKLLLEGAHASEKVRGRFSREARAMAKLRHPNIVAIHEVGEFKDQPYFAMDYVDGLMLSEFIEKFQLTSPVVLADLCARIAEAIHYAHAQGIIHRDLKPGNILMDAHGEPILTDFGLSKDMDSGSVHSVGGEIMGTPAFMSPEQAEGKTSHTNERSDVYAVGAILYTLLTGREPFKGKTLMETLNQVIHKAPAPISSLNKNVDDDLNAICMKAMDKDPHERYASALDLAAELRRFIDGEPVEAAPWGTRRKAILTLQRTSKKLGVLGAGLLLIMLSAWAALHFFARDYLDIAGAYLQSEDAETRIRTISMLGKEALEPKELDPARTGEALSLLSTCFEDPEKDVQTALLAFYADHGDREVVKHTMSDGQFNWLIAAAGQNEHPEQRDLAIQAIGKIRRPPFADYLISRLNEPNPSVRIRLIRALGEQRTRKALSPLMRLISKDPICRAEAEAALEKFYEEGRISLIAKHDRATMSKLKALSQGLAQYNERLEDALDSSSLYVSTPRHPLAPYERMFRSSDPDIRLEAVYGLGQSADEAAGPLLMLALGDEHPDVRGAAAVYLARQNTPELLQSLTRELRSDSKLRRCGAARALGHIGSQQAADMLVIQLAGETDIEVLKALVLSLGETGQASAEPGIREASHKHPGLEAAATQALTVLSEKKSAKPNQ